MYCIIDIYGFIVYFKFGKNEINFVDIQEEVYKVFFDDLDKVVDVLDIYLKEGGKEDGVKSINMCNCFIVSRWIKFVNLLCFCLVMCVFNVDKIFVISEV